MDNIKILKDYEAALSFRQPMAVCAVQGRPYFDGYTTYPICPRCSSSMDREYVSYCDRCGQALDWSQLDRATIRLPPGRKT